MDFAAFKRWQDEVLDSRRDGPPPARFDCLNPFKAMDIFRRWQAPEAGTEADPKAAHARWRAAHGWGEAALASVPTRGVRAALGHLFEAASARGMALVLPRDVYPFYGEEARRRAPGAAVHTFATFEGCLDRALAAVEGVVGPSAVLLVPQPWNTLGRILDPCERAALAAWAAAGSDRWIVLDMVYHYDTRVPPALWAGLPLERTVPLLSMSKSWLVRGVFGGALDLGGRGGWWAEGMPGPTPEAAALALAALGQDPAFPVRQRRVFAAEWARRGHLLAGIPTDPAGPGAGYFRVLRADARRLLEERGLLTVPASVFGHDGPGAVATCLFEAGQAQGVAQAQTQVST